MTELDKLDLRMADKAWKEAVTQQLDENKQMFASLKIAIDANTELTTATHNSTKEVVETFNTFKSMFKFFSAVQSVAVWVSKVAAAFGVLYLVFQFTVAEVLKGILKGK